MNIFERYGIKEVANVYFEALENDPDGFAAGDIVLYLDTLKVSTVETTAENVSAQGGWGNPKLVTWDYGKDINITLEDAVISWEEMRILMGAKMKEGTNEAPLTIRKNHVVDIIGVATPEKPEDGDKLADNLYPAVKAGEGKTTKGHHDAPPAGTTGKFIDMTNGVRGDFTIVEHESTSTDGGEATKTTHLKMTVANAPYFGVKDKAAKIRLFWEDKTTDDAKGATELVISPDRYPGTYRVVGDSLIRSDKGNDEAFQFVINKAKMLSEVTLTMQAEGDPSTFNMTLNVLRDDDGNMMSLIKY